MRDDRTVWLEVAVISITVGFLALLVVSLIALGGVR